MEFDVHAVRKRRPGRPAAKMKKRLMALIDPEGKDLPLSLRRVRPSLRLKVALVDDALLDPGLCLDLLEEADQAPPTQSQYMALAGLRLAKELHLPCLVRRATGVLGTSLVRQGKEQRGLSLLKGAFGKADLCVNCQCDLYRRLSEAHLRKGRLNEALNTNQAAIERYIKINDQVGVAKALVGRSSINFQAGLFEEAIDNSKKALELINPIDLPFFHNAALLNMTASLAKSNDETHFDSVFEKLAAARSSIGYAKGCKEMRAKLRWVEAMVSSRKGRHRKSWRLLSSSQKDFSALGLHAEVVAVSLDIAILRAEHPVDVRDALEFARSVAQSTPALLRALGDIWDVWREGAEAVRSALLSSRDDLSSSFRVPACIMHGGLNPVPAVATSQRVMGF